MNSELHKIKYKTKWKRKLALVRTQSSLPNALLLHNVFNTWTAYKRSEPKSWNWFLIKMARMFAIYRHQRRRRRHRRPRRRRQMWSIAAVTAAEEVKTCLYLNTILSPRLPCVSWKAQIRPPPKANKCVHKMDAHTVELYLCPKNHFYFFPQIERWTSKKNPNGRRRKELNYEKKNRNNNNKMRCALLVPKLLNFHHSFCGYRSIVELMCIAKKFTQTQRMKEMPHRCLHIRIF